MATGPSAPPPTSTGAALTLSVPTGTDLADLALAMTDYDLTALAVTDAIGNLIGAVSIDDVIKALVPEDWRARVEASSGV